MLGNNFLFRANSRLLPASVPFRFFSAAIIFYVLFWVGVFNSADQITGYIIGSGSVLSTIHIATLGVLTMTVLGASLQLLSVATRKAFLSFGMCRLISWIYIPGFMILAYGMFSDWYFCMLLGGALTGLGLAIFFYLIVNNISGVKGMAAIMAHCWAAMASLLGLVGLGLMLIVDFEYGYLDDHMALSISHFVLAVFGFMSLLAMGFSYILVPMFALAPAPSEKIGRVSIGSNVIALIFILAGINGHVDLLIMMGIALGLLGTGLYLYSMTKIYKARMRKRLGMPFLLIRVGWIMLFLTLIWAAVGVFDYWPESGHTILATVAIVGWLLTFLIGILQRIIPFLSSMHTSGSGGIPMLASSMANEGYLKLNGLGHLVGLTGIMTGIILDNEYMIMAASAVGFFGALSLLCYMIIVIRHMIKNQPQKS